MPISGPSSYPPTVREFFEHWAAVNAYLGAGHELVLAGNITATTLGDWRDDLDVFRDVVTDAGVDRTLAREQLNGRVAALQARLVEFNQRVRADLAGTAFARTLQDAFSIGAGEEPVRQALRAMSRLWSKIDAIDPAPPGVTIPMVLLAGYDLGVFDADRELLRTAYGELSNADVDLRLARERRNDLQDVIYPALKAYRMKVPTALPAGHALLDSLPILTPAEGHTPAAVTATAVWEAGPAQAKITWTLSDDADLAEYQVRGVPGDDYVGEDEVVLATVPAGGAREVHTAFSLGTPGLKAGFKVYVVLTTGHEHGSDPVYVARPTV